MNKLPSVQDVDRCVKEKQNSDVGEMQQTAPCHSTSTASKDITLTLAEIRAALVAELQRINQYVLWQDQSWCRNENERQMVEDNEAQDREKFADAVLARIGITQLTKTALRGHNPERGQDSPASFTESEFESASVHQPDVQAADVLRNALQAAFDFYMDMPRACGDFTCACGDVKYCGICAIRESTRKVLAVSPVQRHDADKVLSGFKCRICGSPLVLTHRNASLGQEYTVDETDPVYQAGAPSPVQVDEVSKEQDNAKS